MMKSIIAASVLSLGVASAAYALPAHVATPSQANASDVVQVRKDWKNNDWKRNNWKHGNNWRKYNKHRYSYGGRAPYGWHSYSYRPYGWANRGCVIFGPLWYCP
jgi:hypothetical protein